jgi:osmotically-inducible protein OsmY
MADQDRSNQNDDLAISVRNKLMEYAPLRLAGNRLQVEAQSGVVTLSGNVRSQAVKDTAEQLALKVRRVGKVENRLIADTNLEIAIAQALASDARMRAGFPGILVGVVYGNAFLKGTVPSPEIKKAAGEMAAKVPGVLRVSDELAAPAAQPAKAPAAPPARPAAATAKAAA